MTTLYIDCIGGASGDMLLGALADVGVSQELLRGVIDILHLSNCELRFDRVMKGSMSATQATVTTPRRENHRRLGDLLAVLENADLSPQIKSQAIDILHGLAEVEARIHNQKVENVHLHELGGDDTLIDIVGVLVGLAELKATNIVVSPLPMGHGFTDSAHGFLPLPAPATLALLVDVPIRYVDAEAELVTPTGAALLTSLADHFGGFPPMTLKKVGCGAGHRDLIFPNIVRLWLGDTSIGGDWTIENLIVIETNIDDLNPQVYDYVMERLFEAGALDVTLTPIEMKKNRPAIMLGVLCFPEKADELIKIIFEETTTLGVRRQMVERISLPRRVETVETLYGPIRLKVTHLPSGVDRRIPEYQDCRNAAKAHGVPLLEVIRRLQQDPTLQQNPDDHQSVMSMNNNANTEPSHLFSLDLSRDYPTLVRGEGVYVYDDQGKQYLDAIAGIAVVAIGYGRERVAKTIAEQAMKLPYVASNIFSNEPAIKLADQLARLMPGDCNSIHFTSGGSEAVEAAIKICRQYQYERGKGDKHVLIARWSSYHGATLGALSATGFASRRKKFLPLLLDWPHIPPAYCYRCPFDSDYPGCDLACARSLEEKINQIGQEQVMGFIAEPVVGAAGGALVPPPEYWPMVSEICTLHDVLFIADEVLTGFGRTGKPFAVNHWGISPDMITMAKGLSSGYAPLGAIGISQKIRAVFKEKQVPFDHIFTFSSNPISTAAASEALKIWEEEQLSLRAEKTGEYMLRQLETLKKYEMVGDVRGLGLMAGIEFVQNRGTKEPFPIEKGVAKLVGKVALQKGLVTYPASGIIDGVKGDIISLFPPLVFTPHHVDEMVEKLKAALEEVERMLRINR